MDLLGGGRGWRRPRRGRAAGGASADRLASGWHERDAGRAGDRTAVLRLAADCGGPRVEAFRVGTRVVFAPHRGFVPRAHQLDLEPRQLGCHATQRARLPEAVAELPEIFAHPDHAGNRAQGRFERRSARFEHRGEACRLLERGLHQAGAIVKRVLLACHCEPALCESLRVGAGW